MKKIACIFAVTTLVAAMLSATSCKQDPRKPEFATIEKAETLRMGRNTLDLDYRFEYLSWYSDEDVAARIRTAMIVDFFGEEYVDVNPMESSKAFDQAIIDRYTVSTSAGHGWQGYMKIRSHHDVIDDRIVAYTVEHSEYTGGAHGMETTMYYNYDLRTGERLTLDDVFTPEGKAVLVNYIRGAILKDQGAPSWDALYDEKCYVATDEVRATDNFLLSAGHITFMYNPYDIACYAQGSTRVRLAFDEIEGFKKDMLVK